MYSRYWSLTIRICQQQEWYNKMVYNVSSCLACLQETITKITFNLEYVEISLFNQKDTQDKQDTKDSLNQKDPQEKVCFFFKNFLYLFYNLFLLPFFFTFFF